ncbi:MAG: hypothetical protein A2722_02290 [Candidatus Doudnabacteria bacterium RIFCSPHIGHO2_01_FULL_50_11]|uniref:Uncharacterized protein n=1 Tax=Candidatus Doudnabacteria bacterium RIFCSPHIGHO2_01_FULL_50_11 TaxID=1817828 RepID=A0A1F5PIA3_9BACT|nr:MAG: hypothetical protein A2722_02290 [Candidatus Doudnabacteria bacterium RIFCSPHIGHO2_01_FULL_50_11]HLC44599.1 hypothetical protein [Patescibacteria group bacterium]
MKARVRYIVEIVTVLLGLYPSRALAFNIPNPLGNISGGSSISIINVVLNVIGGFAGLFGLLAFSFLIFNAYKLIIARDNPELLKIAKDGIFNSVLAFIIALLSFTIVSAVSSFLGGTGANEISNANQNILRPPINVPGNDFKGALVTVTTSFLGISFITATLMLVYGGYQMIAAAGNEEMITAGKTIVKWAVVGMLVIILAYTIISALNQFFVSGTP